jgi:uncharacterized FAD-dependent dehydrogenase
MSKLLVTGVITRLVSHGKVCATDSRTTIPSSSKSVIVKAVSKQLGVQPAKIKACEVVRRSIDARQKDIKLVYNVHVEMSSDADAQRVSRRKGSSARPIEEPAPFKATPLPPSCGAMIAGEKRGRPVVIGSGPAGLFAGYTLALLGLRPVVVEQGPRVERRATDLMAFWKQVCISIRESSVFTRVIDSLHASSTGPVNG